MNNEIKPLAFGLAGAIVSAAVMFIMSIFESFGLYLGAVGMMRQWHMFFYPGITGTILGMIEAAIISFVLMYAVALVYNKIVEKSG